MKSSGILMEEPHLFWLVFDLVLNVENSLAAILDGGEDEVLGATSGTMLTMEIEALAVLKGGSMRLLTPPMLSWSVWLFATFKNVKLKCNITIKRNWLSSQWRNDMCSTPDVVSWARESSMISLSKFEDSKFPTLKNLLTSDCELFWITPVLLS